MSLTTATSARARGALSHLPARLIAAGFSIVIALAWATTAWTATLVDPAGWPHSHTDLQPSPKAKFERLPNGFRVVVVPNAVPTHAISLRLLVRAGNLLEEPHQRGFAHFIEHLAFKTAASFPDGQLENRFGALGMATGPDVNASTGLSYTSYSVELTGEDPAALDTALTWFADIAGRLQFDAAAVAMERPVLIAELKAKNDANLRAWEAEVAFLGPELRYRGRLSGGDTAVIAQASAQALQDFYHRWYRSQSMTLVVVGDVTHTQILEQVNHHFSALKAAPTVFPPPGHADLAGARAAVHIDRGLAVTSVRLRSLRARGTAVDNRARRIEHLRARMLHDALTRRLRTLSQQPGAPFTDAAAAVGSFLPGYDSAAVAITGQAGQWRALLTVAEHELRRVLEHGFTQTELEEEVKRMRNYFAQSARVRNAATSEDIANQISTRLRAGEVYTDGKQELALAQAAAANFGPATARAVLDAHWPRGRLRVFVTAPPTPGLAAQAVMQTLASSSRRPVPAVLAHTPEPFAYRHDGQPGEVSIRSAVTDLGVLRLAYANGVTVNLVPTDFERNAVHVRLRVGFGAASSPPSSPELVALANRGLVPGGLRAHSVADLATLFAGKTVGLSFTTGFDAFEFDASTASDNLEDQFRLMSAFVLAPGFRPEGASLAHKQLSAAALTAKRTVRGVLNAEVSRYLRGGDRRFGLPNPDALQALGTAQLRAWLAAPLTTGAIELTIVGDVLPDAAEAAVDTTFGALPLRNGVKPPAPARLTVNAPAAGAPASFELDPSAPHALTLVAWPAPDRSDARRALALEVLAYMLDHQVRAQLRDANGLVYGHYCAFQNVPGAPGYGLLTMQAASSAADQSAVEAQLLAIAGKMREPRQVEATFNAIVKRARTHYQGLMENNQFWLNAVSGSVREPARLDWIRAVRDFDALDWPAIAQLSRRYLVPAQGRRVRLTPLQDSD